MPEISEIEKRLLKAISNCFNRPEDSLQLSTHLFQDLRADSLDLVEAVMAVEDEFVLEIPDEVAEKFETIRDVYEYVVTQVPCST